MEYYYKILDNIVPNEKADELEKLLTGSWFPWYLSASGKTSDDGEYSKRLVDHPNIIEYLQFVHTFLSGEGDEVTSGHLQTVADLLDYFGAEMNVYQILLIRCKANLQTRCDRFEEHNYNTPHKDYENIPHMVLLYYVNDSDGDTVLFDKNNKIIDRISPKKGRFLLFDGNILHAGCHPSKHDTRIVINFDIEYGDKNVN